MKNHYKTHTTSLLNLVPPTTEPDLPALPDLITTPRSRKMNMDREMKIEIDRRDSSSSSDSQSCKKVASLNEIEDLYSALQDLVLNKKSVSPQQSTSQATATNNQDKEQSTQQSTQESTQRLRCNTTIIPSQPTKTEDKKKTVFRRAASTTNGFGNFKPIKSHLRRTSAQPFKSKSVHNTDISKYEERGRKNGRSVSLGGDDEIALKEIAVEIDFKDSKKWKHKFLSRLRSKTGNSKQNSANDKNKITSDDSQQQQRRSPNGSSSAMTTAIKKFDKNGNDVTDGGILRGTKSNELEYMSVNNNVDDIDRLVEALHLEDKCPSVPRTPCSKSVESELSKLESWFEKATAEAVMHHSRTSSDYDNDSDNGNGLASCKDPRRRAINRNKKALLKRNKSIHDPLKRERRMRQVLPTEDYVSNNINSFVRLSLAKSTPDLRDLAEDSDGETNDYSEENSDVSSNYDDMAYDEQDSNPAIDTSEENETIAFKSSRSREEEMNNFEPNYERIADLKMDLANNNNPNAVRRISLEESSRLPKSPVFYRPGDETNLESVTEVGTIQEEVLNNNKKQFERPNSMPEGEELNRSLNSSDDSDEFPGAATSVVRKPRVPTGIVRRPKSLCTSPVFNDFLQNGSTSILNSFLYDAAKENNKSVFRESSQSRQGLLLL